MNKKEVVAATFLLSVLVGSVVLGGCGPSYQEDAAPQAAQTAAQAEPYGLAGTLDSDASDDDAQFYQQTVYAIGLDEKPCNAMQGIPADLWGNSEKIEQKETYFNHDRAVRITGYHEDGSQTSYSFFLSKSECMSSIDPTSRKRTARPTDASESAMPEHPVLKFSGELVRYPKGESEAHLKEAIPELSCLDYEGQRMCSATVTLTQTALVIADFPPCIVGDEIDIFLEHDSVTSVMCQIAPNTAKSLFASYSKQYGSSQQQTQNVGSMDQTTSQWQAGDDIFMIVHDSGQNIYGTPLDSYSLLLKAGKPT